MLGHLQVKGLSTAESSVGTRNVRVADHSRSAAPRGSLVAAESTAESPIGSRPSIFDDCPLCGKQPVEPVRVDSQVTCRTCAGGCAICGAACLPGDDACVECVRGLDFALAAVMR